jgi:hypothetical protein
MPIYHLTQTELVSLFRSRATIARDALARDSRAGVDSEWEQGFHSGSLTAEAATWDAAAAILENSQLPDERSLTFRPNHR